MSEGSSRQSLREIPGCFAVSRLGADAEFPSWVGGEFHSVSRTSNELSIVCEQRFVPEDVRSEKNWALLEVSGPLEFTEVGVIASLTNPLAEAGISIFVLSTFDTDYLLLAKDSLVKAKHVLTEAGHRITSPDQC